MHLYTILFSLGEARKNEYVWCCMIWLKSLFSSGTLQRGDTITIVCDPQTAKHLRASTLIRVAGVQLHEVPAPADCRQGMNLKYMYRPKTEDVVVYMDSDQILRKPFRPDIPPDTLLCYPEGPISDTNYRGDYPYTEGPGFTAGIWAYRRGVRVDEWLDAVLKRCAESEKKFYCLDQPHFNAVIRELAPPLQMLKREAVSFNGHGNVQEAFVLNLAGDPGDGALHFQKMLDMMLLL